MRNMKVSLVLLMFLVTRIAGYAQTPPLKSSMHGLDMIYKPGISKQQVIEDLMFLGGEKSVDVIRIDNVGNTMGGRGPLVLSHLKAVPSDSLGLTSIELSIDSLTALLNLVNQMDTGIKERVHSEYIVRITYRYQGGFFQYYIVGPKEITTFLKAVAGMVDSSANGDKQREVFRFALPLVYFESNQVTLCGYFEAISLRHFSTKSPNASGF